MALLTTAEVADYLPQAAGQTDAFILDFIARAQGVADRLCNRVLESATYDERYDGGTKVIVLKQAPATAVTSVQTDAHTTTPTTLVADSDYYTDLDNGRVYAFGDAWAYQPASLRVQYTAGYTAGTLPDGLRQALLDLVGWLIDTRGDRGTSDTSIDGESQTRRSLRHGMPIDVATAFASWIRFGG